MHPLYIKMEVIEDMKSSTVVELVTKWIEEQSVIQTDKHCSFPIVETKGYKPEAYKFDHKKHPEYLKWLHKMISRLKAFILGTFMALILAIYKTIWMNFVIVLIEENLRVKSLIVGSRLAFLRKQ